MKALLKRIVFVSAVVLFFTSSEVSAADISGSGILTGQMHAAMQRGDFRQAIKAGVAAESYLAEKGPLEDRITVLLRLSSCYQSLGHYRKALDDLKKALQLTGEPGGNPLRASVLCALGNAYMLVEQLEEAGNLLKQAHALGIGEGDVNASASALNYLGNLNVLRKMYGDALVAYTDSLSLAKKAGNRKLTAGLFANTARAMALSGRPEEAGRYLGLAFQAYHELGDSHEKAYGFINIGQNYRTAGISAGKPLFREEAIKSFVEAAAVAERVDDRLSISYAAGYLGQIKEDDCLYDDALRLTRRALIAAQSAGAPESLYLWQWQLGRLLKAQGNPDGALSAYKAGVYTLQSIRQEFSGDCKIYNQLSFQNVIEPVYLGLVELLLRQADLSEAKDNKPLTEAYLIEAVRNIELLKTAELQDYFQNTCVTAVKTTIERQDITIRNTLTVYFIPQPEHLDIVLGSPAGIKKIRVTVDRTTLTREIREFRLLLEKRTSREYLPYAQRLYDWLVRPFERELSSQEIDTIVFVPDGPLRTIPFSALHDGRTFLINRFAVAITPGMSLTDSRGVKREKVELLLTGLSESVQGFPALPYVPLEMKTIRQLYDSKLFLNSQFRIPLVRKELEVSPYSIVHIASHGEFSNNAAETYLLTWDERLTMDQLEQLIRISRFRKTPVELLTLSACQSAAGNDRAALGLAGLSVKAGARSALATLWYINDQASSDLVSEFYRQLSDPLVGKAKALQQAQLTLQKESRYQHPCYWAPFLLVGNWR